MSRAAFEAWASNDGQFPRAVERKGHDYRLAKTQADWQAWQAATEHAVAIVQANAEECDGLMRFVLDANAEAIRGAP